MDQTSIKTVNRDVSQAMQELADAISRKDLMTINEWSQRLFFKALSVFKHPEAWPKERIEEVIELLQHATDATVGSEVHDICSTRPEGFRSLVEDAIRARNDSDVLREAYERDVSEKSLKPL